MVKTDYFKHSFKLSELQIKNIISAVKAKEEITIRLKAKTFTDGNNNIELPLTKADSKHVSDGKSFLYTLSKAKMKFLKINEQTGGFLPIPILLGILGGLATATTAGATVAKTVLDKKANDKRLQEEQRHNLELEKVVNGQGLRSKGDGITSFAEGMFLQPWKNGTSIIAKDFAKTLKLDNLGQKTLRCFLKNLNDNVRIEKHGNGIYLSPY